MDAVQRLEPDQPQLEAWTLTSLRIKGSKELAKKIIDYRSQGEEVTVIGHSYGGQVVTGASALLSNQAMDLSQSALEELTKRTGLALGVKKQLERAKRDVLAYKKKMLGDNPDYLIKKMYTVVSPIDNDVFAARMDVVEHYINIYSAGDYVIPLAGVRLADLGPRTVNLRAFVDGKNPKHEEITDAPFVAKWILDIPDTLKAEGVGGFQNFQYGKNGVIRFSTDLEIPPVYRVDKSRNFFFEGRYMFLKVPGEKAGRFLRSRKKRVELFKDEKKQQVRDFFSERKTSRR
jgi:hypothetical protein